jgi:hypothetical protein
MADEATNPVTPPVSWIPADADNEFRGFVTNRGWDKLAAPAAALEAVKAYREAAAKIGYPADEAFRIPKDPNDKFGFEKVYERLGVPKDATGYTFEGVKFKDGSAPDEAFFAGLSQIALQHHLTPTAATAFAQHIVGLADAEADTVAREEYAQASAEKATLVQEWGPTWQGKEFVAQRAAQALGWGEDLLGRLGAVIGYVSLMKGLLKVGESMSEARLLPGEGARGGVGAMTPAEARAEIARRTADAGFRKKWIVDHDADAEVYMDNLNRIAIGREARRG